MNPGSFGGTVIVNPHSSTDFLVKNKEEILITQLTAKMAPFMAPV